MTTLLDRVPIATIIIIVIALVGGVDLIKDGELSDDFATYAGIVGGSSGLLAIGRGINRHTPTP